MTPHVSVTRHWPTHARRRDPLTNGFSMQAHATVRSPRHERERLQTSTRPPKALSAVVDQTAGLPLTGPHRPWPRCGCPSRNPATASATGYVTPLGAERSRLRRGCLRREAPTRAATPRLLQWTTSGSLGRTALCKRESPAPSGRRQLDGSASCSSAAFLTRAVDRRTPVCDAWVKRVRFAESPAWPAAFTPGLLAERGGPKANADEWRRRARWNRRGRHAQPAAERLPCRRAGAQHCRLIDELAPGPGGCRLRPSASGSLRRSRGCVPILVHR
jgi:hypothetical protein